MLTLTSTCLPHSSPPSPALTTLVRSIHNHPSPSTVYHMLPSNRTVLAKSSCKLLFKSPSVCQPASRGSTARHPTIIPHQMGLLSLLCWLWSPTISQNSLSSPSLLLEKPAPMSPVRNPISIYHSSPKRPRVTFTLPTHIYAWLEAMAVTHYYGSVRKSVRDILAWASVGHEEDLEWLFGTDHQVPDFLDLDIECGTEPSDIAGSQAARGGKVVTLDIKLSPALYDWMGECVSKYGLSGPSVVLETLCRCVIVQGASDDVFGSDESGQTLPTSSAELYHDLGIKCHHWR